MFENILKKYFIMLCWKTH